MEFLLVVSALTALGLAAILALILVGNRRSEGKVLAPRFDQLAAAQNEISGRFAQQIAAQGQLQQMLSTRIEALDKRLGESLSESATRTAETLGGIQTRLGIIDEAQKNITALSGHVVNLQQILSNKQARGAFGQAQMEDIVRDGIPSTLYEFQAKLSNNSRPDCIIRIPGAGTALVIDSKFPLEGFAALRVAATDDERKQASARIRVDVMRHVMDIAEKYLIPGETQVPALMFVPSESIYADLHDQFPEVIQKAHRAHVIVVSPNILMLAINTIQTVMKDARMREQASLIQREVGVLLLDVKRLGERVTALQRHFGQAEGDIKDISISMEKIGRRVSAIEQVDLSTAEPEPAQPQLALTGSAGA